MSVLRPLYILLAGLLIVLPSFAASSSDHPLGWLLDPTTNVAFFAMVAFLLIVWRVGGFRLIVGMLDDRRQKIADELRTALELRHEANELLEKAEKEHQNAVEESKKIIENAKEQAKQIRKDLEETLSVTIKRKQALAETRIRRVETEAIATIQRAASETATAAVALLVSEQDGSKQFDQAASQIDKTIH